MAFGTIDTDSDCRASGTGRSTAATRMHSIVDFSHESAYPMSNVLANV